MVADDDSFWVQFNVVRSHLTSRLAVAAIVLFAFTACGGSSSGSSPEAQVKDVTAAFMQAVIDGRNGVACSHTTNPGVCIAGLAVASGVVGEGGFAALAPDDWRETLDAADVTFADEDHASLPPLGDDLWGDGADFVRSDGEWLIVIEEN